MDFDGDQENDFYISTDRRSYLIDGTTRDTLWMSQADSLIKFENLTYIESIQNWRIYVLYKHPFNSYKIKWIDYPSVTAEDSLSFVASSYIYSDSREMYVGYINRSDAEVFYAQVSVDDGNAIDFSRSYGLMYVFDITSDSLLYSIEMGRPFQNHIITVDGAEYLLHAGNESGWFWPNYFYDNPISLLLNDSLQTICDFGSKMAADILRSIDIYYDVAHNSYRTLLAGDNAVIYFPDIFDDSTFMQSFFPAPNNYAQFLKMGNRNYVIVGSDTGYFELWNIYLSFESFFYEYLPSGIRYIDTEDINYDGNDEVLCRYDSKIVFYAIEEELSVYDSTPEMLSPALRSYPNPFNVATTISYSLPEQGEVTISIYNLLGQRVATLFGGTREAGEHAITWNASDFPSGVYFARLETEGKSENIKMVLLR